MTFWVSLWWAKLIQENIIETEHWALLCYDLIWTWDLTRVVTSLLLLCCSFASGSYRIVGITSPSNLRLLSGEGRIREGKTIKQLKLLFSWLDSETTYYLFIVFIYLHIAIVQVSIVLFEGPLLLLCCSFASGSYRMVSILLFEDPLLLLCRSFASGSYRMVAKKQSQLSSPPSASCRVQSGYVGSVACRVPDAEGLKDVTYLKGFYQPVCLIFEFFSRKIRLVLKCPSCAREDTHFQSAKLFLRHQLLYHLDLKYRCPQCGARLKRYVSAEGRGLSLPESQSGEVLFICLGPTETQQRSTKAKKNVMNAMLPS